MFKKWIKKIAGQEEELKKPSSHEPEEHTGAKELVTNSSTQESSEPSNQSDSIQEKGMEAGAPRLGLFKRLKEQMGKTRGGFVRQMDQLLLGRQEIDPELLDELEELLVMADMGVTTVQNIFEKLRVEVKKKELQDPLALKKRLKEQIVNLLKVPSAQITWTPKPFVVLVVGVNGVGKTTTIAKLACRLKQEGKNVLLVAADTFRAAAVEQLEIWGKRIDVSVIKHSAGSDPSAVAFDGMEAAIKRDVDIVIVDTAGRLHTKVNLMEELKKISRVISKKVEEAPHEVLIVLDATTGQNAISQANLFGEAVGVTGIALTKLDGTAKGGIVVSIANQMQIPIRFIGIGEKMEDLRQFDPEEFVEAIFAEG
ncbi:MAG: signal recognition particle-docking protein FtsY [Deltaproteobacteria bacterium]|nr:signal recognition particle-docking protein FtsY [Deltaproteobacteria bacterium]MBW1932595.1 signal recognition particle-docking protein FtsY [Deltaproteobacteria bacterium]MBW1937715.1 signal recognition particle-docking protein FtsY [Deltaproteobacteria bacterium]MBW1964705.1 signal recognition particle-docking protein FtsY [Deltaproteobacteria bacterium]MBW2079846.1 signal recognition particle-docking protein FtsY [Deltaproteobacteria bacterium]